MPSFDTRQQLIGGQWRVGASGQHLLLSNPSDGSALALIGRGQAADIDAAVNAAQAALDGAWGALSAAERGRLLLRMSTITAVSCSHRRRRGPLEPFSTSSLRP